MKLIKHNHDGWNYYYLKNKNGDTIGTTKYPFPPELVQMAKGKGIELIKLSFKNCQAIERGYDLEELAKSEAIKISETEVRDEKLERIYKRAFSKALEILGDKKFTESDLRLAMHFGKFGKANNQSTTIGFIQSLQQTEWDVEIVQEPAKSDCGPGETNWYNSKLDENGCLILKRVKNA